MITISTYIQYCLLSPEMLYVFFFKPVLQDKAENEKFDRSTGDGGYQATEVLPSVSQAAFN